MTVKSFLSKMISQISNDYNFHHRSLPRARLSSLQSSILHLSICDKCALPNVIVLHDSQTISFNFFNFEMIITFIIDHFRESDQHFWNHLYFICRSATGGHYQILSCYVMAKSFFQNLFFNFQTITTFIIGHFRKSNYHFWNALYFIFRSETVRGDHVLHP